jgi:hypothetical protein
MHASQHQHLKINLILRRYHQQKQQHNLSPGSAVVWESTKCRAMGMEKKQERANSYHHTRAPSSGKRVKTYFLQMQKEMSKSLWMQKGDTTIKNALLTLPQGGVKMSVLAKTLVEIYFAALVRQNY